MEQRIKWKHTHASERERERRGQQQHKSAECDGREMRGNFVSFLLQEEESISLRRTHTVYVLHISTRTVSFPLLSAFMPLSLLLPMLSPLFLLHSFFSPSLLQVCVVRIVAALSLSPHRSSGLHWFRSNFPFLLLRLRDRASTKQNNFSFDERVSLCLLHSVASPLSLS